VEKKEVVIIGGGLAGLTAKLVLDEYSDPSNNVILEKKSKIGGHASNDLLHGHIFDEGPHILFSEDREMLDFLGSPQPELYLRSPVINNYWRGRVLSHPAHLDFAGINDPIFVSQLLSSMEESFSLRTADIVNYKQWVEAFLGGFVSENFTKTYTKKYWRVNLDDLGIDWISKRISHLSLDQFKEVVRSYLEHNTSPTKLDQHYLSKYIYHKEGFIKLFPKLQNVDVSREEVLNIDLKSKVILTNKRKLGYSSVISTIPLTELLPKVDIAFPIDSLRHTSLMLLNLVFTAGEIEPKAKPHWIYNYDECSKSSRISFPQRFLNDSTQVTQCQVEFYFESSSESAPEIDPTREFAVLKEMSLISHGSSLLASQVKLIEYANIMPTVERNSTVQEVESLLNASQIYLAGRYGAWSYLWSVESARSGYESAKKYLSNRI
jgi:protoporphyrinogen oxidase